jgi:prolyl oligopeptidase
MKGKQTPVDSISFDPEAQSVTRRDYLAGALAMSTLALGGLSAQQLLAAGTKNGGHMPMKYPQIRKSNDMEIRAGVEFPDPYRWLESDTDEVRQWQRAQAALASSYVREWPYFEELKKSVARFSATERAWIPRFAGGKWFRKQGEQIVAADTPFGAGRVLFDPHREKPENPATPSVASWISPSPDGRLIALGVCTNGSENNTIRLVTVATGASLPKPPPQLLMDSWTGGAGWLPDSSGFFFQALVGPAHAFKRQTLFHDIATSTQTEVTLPSVDQESQDYTLINASHDGRYLVANHRLSTPIPVALKDLSKLGSDWRPFVTEVKGSVAGYVVGDRFIALTDIGAPRGRVVGIALDTKTPNDPATWTELVPESKAVIRSLTLVGNTVYLNELVDTYSRVRILKNGGGVSEVPLPGKGAVANMGFPLMSLIPKGHPNEFIFSFSSLTASTGVYRYSPGRKELEVLDAPANVLDDAVIEDYWATSADGTKIPYHTVRLKSVDFSKPRPTLINAYGGFGIAWPVAFPGPMAAFVMSGGVFICANIRGGGEFGLDWWEAGRLKHKQNGYADLYAVAEDMIKSGRTKSHLLAVTGGSNGGLMAGVAATQRPDLWKVVVPQVPLLDVIGAMRDPYGLHFIRMEFGDPDDPAEVRRMAGFSPYQLIKNGVQYPAVFVVAGDTDPRCPAWHSRKFAARLQAANAADTPILVHIWENAGHGGATDKGVQVTQATEWLAFTMRQLGMTA